MTRVRLQTVLQDLNERYGATAADLTAEELTYLVHACERVDNPYAAFNAELMERPIRAGGGLFVWPVTLGAHIWLMEYAAQWWKPDSALFRFAQVYAVIHAREPEAFEPLTTKAAAWAAIVKTLLRVTVHVKEVLRAVDAAYGVDPFYVPKASTERREETKEDFYALVARLEVTSGIPAQKWLWGRSVRATLKSYVEMSEMAVAAFGSKHTQAKQELDDAIENLARVCANIAGRLEKKANA